MASKVVKDMSQDFLNCCICMNQFKTPKMLPCIHSFCETCLEKYATKQNDNEIPCPICRKVCKLPERGVKGLQTNFHLINLAEKVTLLEKLTSTKKKVHVCDSCKTPEIVAYCVDCNFAICSKCQSHHALFPLLRSHSVIPIKKMNDPKFQQEWKNAKSPYCGLHNSEKLRFYCKTCAQLICRDCTIVLHCKPGHDCTEAVSQFDKYKDTLSKLLEESNDQLEKGLNFIKEGEEGFEAILASKKNTEAELTKCCEDMMEEIKQKYNKQKEEILGEISELRAQPVETQVQSAKDWVKRMQNAQEMTEKVIRENNPWELLAMQTELTSAFKTLKGDSEVFEWDKSQLQHEIIFQPDKVPEVKLGTCYYPANVAVSDSEGNFVLCHFDQSKKTLSFRKLMKNSNYSNVENFPPYKLQNEIAEGTRLTMTVSSHGYLFVGLGNVVIKFDSKFCCIQSRVLAGINRGIQCIGYKTNNPYVCIVDNSFNNTLEYCNSTNLARSGSYMLTAKSPVELIHPGYYQVLYYTKKDGLKAYYWGNNAQDTSYIIDPPTKGIFITDTYLLHGVYEGNFRKSSNINYDQFSAYLVWKGMKLDQGKHNGAEAWVLKEYCTKENKVLGILDSPEGGIVKSPAAMFSVKTADGGMEINLCDNLGRVTSYKRGPYIEKPVHFERIQEIRVKLATV